MYSTRTRVNARIPTDIIGEKARVRTKVRGQVGELNGPRAPTACRCARRTRRLPRDDPRTEVGEEVRVGVGVRVGPLMEFSYKPATSIDR